MATVEYIQKRIDGKKAELEKLHKKLDRIEKAEATGWKVNPYYYDENDKRRTLKEIEIAESSLADYQDELRVTFEKAQSRNVPAITEFLDKWEETTIAFMLSEKPKYDEAYKELKKKRYDLIDRWNHGYYNDKYDEYKKDDAEYKKYKANFQTRWAYITQFMHGANDWETTMKSDIAKEKVRKYDFIIERTNAIVGQITDASNLRVDGRGELGGIIIGTRGKASVRTIGAGGYNIQCFHFRTLIREI